MLRENYIFNFLKYLKRIRVLRNVRSELRWLYLLKDIKMYFFALTFKNASSLLPTYFWRNTEVYKRTLPRQQRMHANRNAFPNLVKRNYFINNLFYETFVLTFFLSKSKQNIPDEILWFFLDMIEWRMKYKLSLW